MNIRESTSRLVMSALLAALTFLATDLLHIATPLGYMHLGDTFVLLSGFLLGPLYGGLAAGLGSLLADLVSGYSVYAPGTFVIKFAMAAGVSRLLPLFLRFRKTEKAAAVIAGTIAELFMVICYFFYDILILTLFSGSTPAAAAAATAAVLPFRAMQGISGCVLACVLWPLLRRARGAVRQE